MSDTRIQATTFDEPQLTDMISQLSKRFTAGGTSGQLTESLRLHDRIRWRRAHFFNLPEADPQLPEPWDRDARKYQTDALRQVHNELKARLCENHFAWECDPPRDIPSKRDRAEMGEKVLNEGFLQLEQKRGFSIQGALSDGQIIDGLAVLHWRLMSEIWPEIPDYEWVEELPADEADNYKPRRERKPDGKLAYRETDASVRSRYAQAKAKAGYPWMVQVLDPTSVFFLRDQANNLPLVVHVEIVGLLDYDKALQSSDALRVSINQLDKKVRIYVEEPAPEAWSPSAFEWGDEVAIARVWTRDEYYELVCETGVADGQVQFEAGWQLVRSHSHPYGMPPFAICPAFEINNPDPGLRYQPALAGMYAVKPFYDKKHAFLDILAESVAVPLYYLKQVGTGLPLLKEDGSGEMVTLTASAASAMQVPDGYDLVELRPEINQAYVMSVQTTKEELMDAKPATGQVQLGASSKPWAIRMLQAQANVGPSFLLENQRRTIEIMGRNMAYVMAMSADEGGLGEDVTMYCGADKRERKLLSVAPEDWKEITVHAKVDPTTGSERITLEEHGRELLNDPLVPITRERFGDDYMGWDDTGERISEWEAETIYDQFFRPAVVKFVTATWAGTQFVIGPNGEDIAMGGQPATPEQIGQANGITPMGPPPGQPAQPQGPMGAPQAPQPQVAQQTVPPPLPPMQAPGMAPLAGMR